MISYDATVTYGEQSRRLGCPRSVRTVDVGTALFPYGDGGGRRMRGVLFHFVCTDAAVNFSSGQGGYGPHLQSRKGLAVHRHNSSSVKQDCSEYAPCSAVARSLPKRVSDRARLWSVTSVAHTVTVFERRHSGLFLEDAAQI